MTGSAWNADSLLSDFGTGRRGYYRHSGLVIIGYYAPALGVIKLHRDPTVFLSHGAAA